jgi:predicted metal-binding membrane protein
MVQTSLACRAAMMFPPVAPAIALYAGMTRQRSPQLPLLFAAGYLLTWAAAGVIAASRRTRRIRHARRCVRLGPCGPMGLPWMLSLPR